MASARICDKCGAIFGERYIDEYPYMFSIKTFMPLNGDRFKSVELCDNCRADLASFWESIKGAPDNE